MMWTPSTLSARIPLPVTMEMASSKLRARYAPVGACLLDTLFTHKLMPEDIANYVLTINSNRFYISISLRCQLLFLGKYFGFCLKSFIIQDLDKISN